MQILQINNFYPFDTIGDNKKQTGFHYPYGGTETVIKSTAHLLEANGHKAIFFSMQHPENLYCETSEYFVSYVDFNARYNIVEQLKVAGRILYSLDSRKNLSELLDRYPVDIAHLHTINHHISPSILHELKKRKIPMVMTLHDYKMVCASYSMLVDGRPCEACCGGKYFKAIFKRCVKDSFAKSALAALEMYLHHKILDIFDKVDVFVSPSLFLKNKIIGMGFKKDIVYLPNFIDIKKFEGIEGEDTESHSGDSIVYFGRLSPEKGLWTLLEAAKLLSYDIEGKKIEIKIIGDGPIIDKLRLKASVEGINNVKFLGYMKGEFLYQEIKRSLAVVLPSECYENNPMSVLESFASGIPVIGSRMGGIPELVIDGVTGFTFEAGNAHDLKSKVELLMKDKIASNKLGKNARKLIENKFNAEIYFENLMRIYEKVLKKYGN